MAKKEIESVVETPRSTQTYNGGNLRGVSSNTSENLANYEKGYTQSDSVSKAKQNLESVQSKKPGEFTSGFETELNNLYDEIKNRGPFTYDMDSDALYQQYANQYKKQGKQAMQDTIGQASAMTGGYGNSYAETAGYQAYAKYMDELNDRAMEFYQLAQDRYDREGDRLNSLYGLAKDRYDTDYSQYRDEMSDYYNDYSNAYNAYNDERGFDYQQYQDMLAYWQQQAQAENTDWWNQTNYDYQKERDSVADSQWAQQMAYQKERDAVADSQWAKEFAETQSNNAYNRSVSSAKAAAEAAEEDYKSLVAAGKAIFNEGKDGSEPFLTWMDNMLNGGLVDNDTAAKVIDEVMKGYEDNNKLSKKQNQTMDKLQEDMFSEYLKNKK